MKRDVGRLWKLKHMEVVSVVEGAIRSVTKDFEGWIRKLGVTYNTGVMQKTVSCWEQQEYCAKC